MSGEWGFEVILCGVRGVGKSTMLRGISDKSFESGLSFGGGLTKGCQSQISTEFVPGCTYRFWDVEGMFAAGSSGSGAKAIREALETAARDRTGVLLAFVMKLDEGRWRMEDLRVIEQVINAIQETSGQPVRRDGYGIIINRCDFIAMDDFDSVLKPLYLEQLREMLTVPTAVVKFMPEIREASSAKNFDLGSCKPELCHQLQSLFRPPPDSAAAAAATHLSIPPLRIQVHDAQRIDEREPEAIVAEQNARHEEEMRAVTQRHPQRSAMEVRRIQREFDEVAARKNHELWAAFLAGVGVAIAGKKAFVAFARGL